MEHYSPREETRTGIQEYQPPVRMSSFGWFTAAALGTVLGIIGSGLALLTALPLKP
jgi:hypothetical protein